MLSAVGKESAPCSQTVPSPLYEGVFEYVEKGYGFVNKVRIVGSDGIALIGGIFLRNAILREMKRGKMAGIEELDGQTVRFHVRPSESHPGKLEACQIIVKERSPYFPL